MTICKQTAHDDNIKAIVSYFESGVDATSQRLGIELEHTLVTDKKTSLSYYGDHGVEWVLEQLTQYYPEVTKDPKDGLFLGVAAKGEAVTIEPAAQLELSAGPFEELSTAQECFERFERRLSSVLEPTGTHVLAVGYNPFEKSTDLDLIPKERYGFMNDYLGAISPYGVAMMRGSASTQVSIDYSSVEDCIRKLKLAFSLVPILSLVCDNSPVFEGKPREHQLVRTQIWRYCDPDRCGVVPGVLDDDFSLETYAEYILNTPAILIQNADGEWISDKRTFGEIYADRVMTKAEVEHALSMFFTDVRLKTYIEIRPADAMPIPYVIAYAALIKGLFYSEDSLNALESLFANVTEQAIDEAKTDLMDKGYAATVYGKPVAELADRVFEIATSGLKENERSFLEPLLKLVNTRTTLADIFAQ